MNWIRLIFTYFLIALFMLSCADDDGFSDFTKSENFKILGASSENLLTDKVFSKLKVEIVYEEGMGLSPGTISNFKTFLQSRLYKSEIKIEQRSIPGNRASALSIEDIIRIEQNHRRAFNTLEEITVFVYATRAQNIDDSDEKRTLGTAYLNTSIVLYGKTLREITASLKNTSLEVVETAALQHEFAHLLGLVNKDSSADGNNTSHTSHCDNKNCLMASNILFPSNETNTVDKQFPKLGKNCLLQLKQHGGK